MSVSFILFSKYMPQLVKETSDNDDKSLTTSQIECQ